MIADEETWHPSTRRLRSAPFTDHEFPKARREGAGDRGGRSSGQPNPGGRAGSFGARGGRTPVWRAKEPRANDGNGSRKRNSEEAEVDGNTGDTATSPLKPIPEEATSEKEKASAQRQLDMKGALVSDSALAEVPPPPPKYISPREQKRSRREAAKAGKSV